MNRLNETKSAIFVSMMCSVLPEDHHSELVLSSLQLVLCLVAAVKYLSIHPDMKRVLKKSTRVSTEY